MSFLVGYLDYLAIGYVVWRWFVILPKRLKGIGRSMRYDMLAFDLDVESILVEQMNLGRLSGILQ
jgi:hypothetical protein